ncbi:MAG: hypothetical protein WED34_09080 [Planctomycetales bacterium]
MLVEIPIPFVAFDVPLAFPFRFAASQFDTAAPVIPPIRLKPQPSQTAFTRRIVPSTARRSFPFSSSDCWYASICSAIGFSS